MKSLDESARILAKIAVERNFVPLEAVEAVLERPEARKKRVSLAEHLLNLGYLDETQFKKLMALHHKACKDLNRRADQKLFGQSVLARGLASPREIAEALKLQAELAAKGDHKNLGQVLVQNGIVTADQVKSLLEEQDKQIMYCPECAEQYNVLRKWEVSARCPADGAALSKASREVDVGVAATLDRPSATDTSPIGLEVGGCRLMEVIGRGAMGTVYKAKHVGLNRFVAVKLIPTAKQDPTVAKRLLFEARSIAKLEHPNIVQVYDTGFQGTHFFMVMQLLRGRTLEDLIKELGGTTHDEALNIGKDIAKGLDAAHQAGIIHRDLKPANIFLTEDGRARLTDFGLAQDTARPDELSGYIVGTPNYMSPEQWQGNAADARSDLYSLGVIVYQLVCGRKPFEGKNHDDLREAHLNRKPPDPKTLNSEITDGLSAVLRKLLAKSPAKRYADAKALLADIAKIRRAEDPDALANFGKFLKCGFCETLNPVGTRKCKICNETLAPQKGSGLHLALRDDEFECADCKGVNPKGARSCSQCTRLFCPRCGVRTVSQEGRICGGCSGRPTTRRR